MSTATYYDQEYWRDGKNAVLRWARPVFEKVMAPLFNRSRVLDYGCGMGYAYQAALAAAVKQYVAADASDMAVEDARKKGYEAVAVNPETGRIPLPDSSLDGAVCVEVLEHLFDPLSAARELHRMLKPGGVLVATVPNFGYLAWRLQALLRAQVPSEPDDPKTNRFNGVHIRFFSKLMFTRLLRDAGFVDIKIRSFDDSSIWDVFYAGGPLARISIFAQKHLPSFMHLRFLQNLCPNVFAKRLRAEARKP